MMEPPAEGEASSDEEVTTEMAKSLLKLDARSIAKHQKKEFGMEDFVAQKTIDFLLVQEKLAGLDHNTNRDDLA